MALHRGAASWARQSASSGCGWCRQSRDGLIVGRRDRWHATGRQELVRVFGLDDLRITARPAEHELDEGTRGLQSPPHGLQRPSAVKGPPAWPVLQLRGELGDRLPHEATDLAEHGVLGSPRAVGGKPRRRIRLLRSGTSGRDTDSVIVTKQLDADPADKEGGRRKARCARIVMAEIKLLDREALPVASAGS